MIDLNALPQDKQSKEEHLLARKLQVMELLAAVVEDDFTGLHQMTGLMWSTIEEIDGLLDE